ncbi:uncharacterized protein LY79DRAFT_570197, partial [Colletotrichum navitas]
MWPLRLLLCTVAATCAMCISSEPFVVRWMMRGRNKRQRRSNLRSSLDTSSARHRPPLVSSRCRRRQAHAAGVEFEFRNLSCHQPKLHVSSVQCASTRVADQEEPWQVKKVGRIIGRNANVSTL